MTTPHVTIKKYEEMTGITEKAVRRKIESGVWLEGVQFHKAPDGHIMVDLEGVNGWIEKRELRPAGRVSASFSNGGEQGAARL